MTTPCPCPAPAYEGDPPREEREPLTTDRAAELAFEELQAEIDIARWMRGEDVR